VDIVFCSFLVLTQIMNKPPSETYRVPIFSPSLPRARQILPYLESIDKSGWYSNFGPLSKELEKRIASYTNVATENVVCLVNATLALQGAVSTANRNASWSCPSWTFAATPHAVLSAGKDLELLDITHNWRMNPQNTKNSIGNFIDVLPFGDDLCLDRFSNDTNALIIDAAGSFDSLRNLELDVSYPVGIVISLHPTKALAGGEGAVFISNDSEWVARLRQWANFGFDQHRQAVTPGTNAKMSEYACAVSLSSLDVWDNTRDEWLELQKWSLGCSSDAALKVQPSMNKGFASPYWIVEGEPERIKRLRSLLESRNIQSRQWWGLGCHKMKAFEKIAGGDYRNTDALAITTLGLPYFRGITDDQRCLIEEVLQEL
jgi:dTDP-4-amino-4,6-dideoxygalactose transaminase